MSSSIPQLRPPRIGQSVVVRNERVDSDGWREKEKRSKTATDTNQGEILRAGEGGLIGP